MTANNIQLREQGFTIFDSIFSDEEVRSVVDVIEAAGSSEPRYAIRRFLGEIPAITTSLFNERFTALVRELAGPDHFVVKSIYFDKPKGSNWFVAWHQDLTISVDRKIEYAGFGPWTVKQESYAVQPPVALLETIVTFRIHLDDTDEKNGALKVIPGSHKLGVIRPGEEKTGQQEEYCPVGKGGVMIMRPLLMHASGRVLDERQRRVIHIEFSNSTLPGGLKWAEQLVI